MFSKFFFLGLFVFVKLFSLLLCVTSVILLCQPFQHSLNLPFMYLLFLLVLVTCLQLLCYDFIQQVLMRLVGWIIGLAWVWNNNCLYPSILWWSFSFCPSFIIRLISDITKLFFIFLLQWLFPYILLILSP